MEQVLVLAALLGACCLVLRAERLLPERGGGRVAVLLALLAAFLARYLLLDRCGSAAEDAARDALAYFRGAGGFWGIRACTEPFSVPVQYFLALFSHARSGGIYLYKYLGFLADIAAAWACQRCVGSVTVKARPRRGTFLAVLLLPSVILQGCAAMGQSLRWAFPLLAAAALLRGNFRAGSALLGLGTAFAPGMLWLVPVFWIFPALRQNTGRSLPWMAGGYLLPLLPALLLGRSGAITLPFWPGLSVLMAGPVNAGAPGLYALELPAASAPVGYAAGAVLLALALFRLTGRDAVRDRRRQLAGLALSALAAAVLFPRMPAGALYGAEALLIVLTALEPGMFPAAVCACAASALALGRALFPGLVVWPFWWGCAAAGIALAILLGHVMLRRN